MIDIRLRATAILLILSCSALAQAQQSTVSAAGNKTGAVPNVIRFSGSFRPSNGMPAQAVESVTLSVYRDQSGGAPLWQETQNVPVDGEGKYSALMGATQDDGVPLDLLSAGEPRWLGAQFNRPGEAEQPRVLMTSVPYALKASDAETLGGRPASAYLLAPPGINGLSNLGGSAVSSGASSTTAPATSTTVLTNASTAMKPRATSGTTGYIGVFTDATDIGNSVMQQSGGSIGVGTVPGAGAATTPSLDLRTSPFSQIGMAQTTDYLTFFASDTYGPAIYWDPNKDLRFGKGGTPLYNAFGFTEQMRIQSATGNVGIGTQAPAQKLDVAGNINLSGNVLAQGSTALNLSQLASNASIGLGTALGLNTGAFNTATGYGALENNAAANYNTANGAFALASNTLGGANTAVGYDALEQNNSGSNNTALGYQALQSNNGGGAGENTAVGSGALASNTGGSNNTAVGYQALQLTQGSVSSGYLNTAVGSNALQSNTAGTQNTAVGYQALQYVASGTGNIAIGSYAGNNARGADSLNIYIGSLGQTGDNNTIRIGDCCVSQTSFFASGIYGVSPSPSGVPVVINTNGQLGAPSSSRRYKEDIQDMSDTSRGLMDLRPVTFRYKKAAQDGSKPMQYGLIAEEVADVYPDLVVYKDGQPDAVQYQMLPSMLLNEVQRQQTEIGAQRDQLQKLTQQIDEQREQINAQRRENQSLQERLARLEAALTSRP